MTFLSLLLSGLAVASAAAIHSRDDNSTSTIANLGSAGSYQGVIQNNGTYVLAQYISRMTKAHVSMQRSLLERHSLCRAASRKTAFHAA